MFSWCSSQFITHGPFYYIITGDLWLGANEVEEETKPEVAMHGGIAALSDKMSMIICPVFEFAGPPCTETGGATANYHFHTTGKLLYFTIPLLSVQGEHANLGHSVCDSTWRGHPNFVRFASTFVELRKYFMSLLLLMFLITRQRGSHDRLR